jgi:hypothetical protein
MLATTTRTAPQRTIKKDTYISLFDAFNWIVDNVDIGINRGTYDNPFAIVEILQDLICAGKIQSLRGKKPGSKEFIPINKLGKKIYVDPITSIITKTRGSPIILYDNVELLRSELEKEIKANPNYLIKHNEGRVKAGKKLSKTRRPLRKIILTRFNAHLKNLKKEFPKTEMQELKEKKPIKNLTVLSETIFNEIYNNAEELKEFENIKGIHDSIDNGKRYIARIISEYIDKVVELQSKDTSTSVIIPTS